MLKPAQMTLIRVIGLRKDLDEAVKLLQDLGTVQFRRPGDTRLGAEKPMEYYAPVVEQLVRMRAIESVLEPQPMKSKAHEMQLGQLLVEAETLDLDSRLNEITRRQEDISLEKAELEEAARIMRGLSDVPLDLDVIKSKELGVFIGRISTERLPEFERIVRATTTRYMLRARLLSKFESVILLAVDGHYKEQTEQALDSMGFAEAKLPQIPGNPAQILVKVKERIHHLDAESAHLRAEIRTISKKHYAHVVALREMLEMYADRAQAPQIFGRTLYAFVLEGWLPSTKLPEVTAALTAKFGGEIQFEVVETHDTPPTLLKNPGMFSPFEFMISFISLPKGNELDPTILFALIFPLFYGMMLGDFGYGLISLVLAYFLARKFKGSLLEPVAKIWMIVAVPAMFFGVVYDEYFGFTHEQLLGFTLYHSYPRMENISLLLLITIFLGAFHLMLGFLIGAYGKFKEGHFWHGAAKLAWIGIEISGMSLVAAMMFHALPDFIVLPAAALGLLGLVVVLKGEGVTGLIELPGLASNIFSYARILAVGIASVVVAELINEILFPRPELGLVAIALVPIYLTLHLVNIIIGMFEALVQGARLNYVEFFSKFYEGGGEPFNPFRYVKKFIT